MNFGIVSTILNGIIDNKGNDTARKARNGVNSTIQTGKEIMDVGRASNSIKERTKNLVLQYPILASNSISLENIKILTRSFEHEYANLLVLLISDESVKGMSDASTSDYLRNFHNNLDQEPALTEGMAMKANKDLLLVESDLFNFDNLNEMTMPEMFLKEAVKNNSGKKGTSNKKEEENDSNQKEKNFNKDQKAPSYNYSAEQYNKVNSLAPTIIKGNIKIVPDKGNAFNKEINFGIKTVVHPLNSDDIIYYLSSKVKNGSLLFKLIQWTTGEKKLISDLLLNKQEMKEKALRTRNKNNFWWKKLEDLSRTARTSKGINLLKGHSKTNIGSAAIPIPTVTMVISKQEADTIKNREGIDILKDPSYARKIINNFYLLTFAIMDDTTDTCYIFNDVSGRFAQFSMNQLKNFSKDKALDIDDLKSLFTMGK